MENRTSDIERQNVVTYNNTYFCNHTEYSVKNTKYVAQIELLE